MLFPGKTDRKVAEELVVHFNTISKEFESLEPSETNNQFGGVKGRSADHMLVAMWQKICGDLEDCRAGTLITLINYAKAFNHLSFQECLAAFACKGANTELLAILATFLTNQMMSEKIEQE